MAGANDSQSGLCGQLSHVRLLWLGMSEDALRWLLGRLPHGEPAEASVPPLSAAAKAFLNGFVVNDGAVQVPLEFTIFGKGPELVDRVDQSG